MSITVGYIPELYLKQYTTIYLTQMHDGRPGLPQDRNRGCSSPPWPPGGAAERCCQADVGAVLR